MVDAAERTGAPALVNAVRHGLVCQVGAGPGVEDDAEVDFLGYEGGHEIFFNDAGRGAGGEERRVVSS